MTYRNVRFNAHEYSRFECLCSPTDALIY